MKIACPNCSQPLGVDEKLCPHCGINLTLAVMLAERYLISPPIPSGAPITPEILVPRLGDYLIEKGVLTHENLHVALEHQRESERSGQPRLLGQTLLDLDLVDREVLDQVITEQILQLQAALHESNQKLEIRVQERTLDLQNALQRLTELNQLKSGFISSISHELRTPLTHIKGYLDILVEEELGPLNPAQKDVIDVMQRAEKRLEQLIDDLLKISMASKGELSLSMTTVRINDILESAAGRIEKTAQTKNISLFVELANGQPVVIADHEKLSWVLFQLLDNAIKFTDTGGSVRLKAHLEGNIVMLSVADTGIGIPPERVGEIFEPFHQLDNLDSRRYAGTGLGLALVKSIVEAHASSIKVKSQEGRGSIFEFCLPVTQSVYV
jgi:signal transduction histidine kinase